MDTFLFHRHCTSQNHGTAGNREAGSFVNSAVNLGVVGHTFKSVLSVFISTKVKIQIKSLCSIEGEQNLNVLLKYRNVHLKISKKYIITWH